MNGLERKRGVLGTLLSTLLGLLGAAACQAPAPPVAIETPFGMVRAETEGKAEEVAEMLEVLSPRVRDLLPGTFDRRIDVWVQSVLRSSRYGQRATGVKGFTLLADEFDAQRIHLLEDGELSWYLSHELVHALVDESWSTLPGLLEEGLGDVVAEELNPEYAARIRAHRLFTSSGFTGGILFQLVYRLPSRDGRGDWVEAPMRLRVLEEYPDVDPNALLGLSRRELRKEWRELPEPFYGLAYLVVARIVENVGFEGLHALCTEAEAAGLDLIPTDRILEAAGIPPGPLDAEFLASEFGRTETRQLLMMQPEMFGDTVAAYFKSSHGDLSSRDLLYRVNPCLRSADGGLLRLRSLWPVRQQILSAW